MAPHKVCDDYEMIPLKHKDGAWHRLGLNEEQSQIPPTGSFRIVHGCMCHMPLRAVTFSLCACPAASTIGPEGLRCQTCTGLLAGTREDWPCPAGGP